MVVRNLDQYLQENRLIHTTPLHSLSNTRLGVDALTYLRKVISDPRNVEHFTPSATGGVPITLATQIEKDLKVLEKFKIKPVFVFNGIKPMHERPFCVDSRLVIGRGNSTGSPGSSPSSPNLAANQISQPPNSPRMNHPGQPNQMPVSTEIDKSYMRSRAWMAYEQNHTDEAKQLFAQTISPLPSLSSPPSTPPGDIATSFQADLLRLVNKLFKQRNVEFMTAPYLSIAQLVYLERHPKQYIHSIWGPDELLMFDLQALGSQEMSMGGNQNWDRIIIDIDFSSPLKESSANFSWVSKSEILKSLGLNHEQFLDLSILAGFEHAPTFPPLISYQQTAHNQPHPPYFMFPRAVEFLKQHGNALNMFRNVFPNPEAYLPIPHPYANKSSYLDLFTRSRLLFRFPLVLTSPMPANEKGQTSFLLPPTSSSTNGGRDLSVWIKPLPLALPLNPSVLPPPPPSQSPRPHQQNPNLLYAGPLPSDLHVVHSRRLPDEIYFHLFRGLCDARLLNALTSGWWKEDVPLDLSGGPGELDEWRKWVRECTEHTLSPKCVALALIVKELHSTWFKQKVMAVYHFDPSNQYAIPYTHKETQELVSRVKYWRVPADQVEEELRRQISSTIDLMLCLGGVSTPGLAQKTTKVKEGVKPLERKDEVVANTLWRFLELRRFLLGDHTHTAWGKAMYAALRTARVNDKFQESLFLAIEMIRGNVLHNKRFSGRSWSGGPQFGEEFEKRNMLLIMRVVSIVPLNFKPIAWTTAPLSRELLVFNSFLRTLSRSLRSLVEATVISMLLRGEARRSREDYVEIALSLPFQSDTGTGMGILFKAWGDAVTALSGGPDTIRNAVKGGEEERRRVSEAKENTLPMLEGAFGNVRDVRAELERAIRFWDTLLIAVKSLRESSVVDETFLQQFDVANDHLKPFRL